MRIFLVSKGKVFRCFLVCAIALIGSLLLLSCSMGTDAAIAKRGVDVFHRQLATGQDDVIYETADPKFRASVSEEAAHAFLARIHQKMGACQDSKNIGYLVNKSTNGTFVTLQYRTKCTHGDLDERFVWRIERDQSLLVSYRANSPIFGSGK